MRAPGRGVGGGWRGLAAAWLLVVAAAPALATEPASTEPAVTGEAVTFGQDGALQTTEQQPELWGTSVAAAGSEVRVTIGETTAVTTVEPSGDWRLTWPEVLPGAGYRVVVEVVGPNGTATTEGVLAVQPEARLPRRPLLRVGEPIARWPQSERDDFHAYTDRWRIVPPPYELLSQGSLWNPYDQNVLKGDRPVFGDDVFFVLTAVSDTLVEGRTLPTPSGVSTTTPEIDFFGEEGQLFVLGNAFLSFELFRGDTAFRPPDWRVRATLAANVNHLEVDENAVVKPDVRRGTTRTDGRGSLQEAFVEVKLADLSPNYDFVSVRAGIQPFASDFRGFVYSDTNLGVRLFGNHDSNRGQYNLAWFERLEKDTNSGLNTFELRDQQVGIANYYRQDFPSLGWTQQLSLHYLRDEPSFHFDRNGFLVRPDPAGSFTPHEVEAFYLGWASFGHVGRLNIDHALYFVTGDDSLNPIAGPDVFGGRDEVDVEAWMGALELSVDRDWFRPKVSLFYASGDDDPTDRDARGFDAIFDNPAFAGGGFSFWNRMGIRLAQTGVTLVNRGSLLPDLKSSKEEGQPNFVNPGLLLASLGLDVEVTPEIRMVATANYLRFDTTAPIELLLFQSGIDEEIGWDLSLGARWRPLLNNNVIVLAGAAAFLPGKGFEAIYEDDDPLYAAFTNLVLTF
ncbi:MAG TPA: hypothetical protein VKU40_10050 [Thermoanaerobaculia bacterium]|nr:hypothetical protein [Thermoanaerobaculia bacterium]